MGTHFSIDSRFCLYYSRRTFGWGTQSVVAASSAPSSLAVRRAASANNLLGKLCVESQDDFAGVCPVTGCSFTRYACV
jgi:hypothetical protein